MIGAFASPSISALPVRCLLVASVLSLVSWMQGGGPASLSARGCDVHLPST